MSFNAKPLELCAMDCSCLVVADLAHVARAQSPLLAGGDCGCDLTAGEGVGGTPATRTHPEAARMADASSPSRTVQWRRGVAASAIFALGCGLHMALAMSPNTSWGHHPFSGPLVALHESRHPLDYAVSGGLFLVLGAWPFCRPHLREQLP